MSFGSVRSATAGGVRMTKLIGPKVFAARTIFVYEAANRRLPCSHGNHTQGVFHSELRRSLGVVPEVRSAPQNLARGTGGLHLPLAPVLSIGAGRIEEGAGFLNSPGVEVGTGSATRRLWFLIRNFHFYRIPLKGAFFSTPMI